jgi:hypothetical protein
MKNNPDGNYECKPIYNTLKQRVSELRRKIDDITEIKVIGFVKFSTNKYIQLQIPPENVFINDTRPITDDPNWANL